MARAQKLTQPVIMKLLDSAYEASLTGLPGFDSSEELAENYLKNSSNVSEAADKIVKWQIAKCGASGFISGLGGILTLPVAVPANMASVIYVQMRMIASIAYMGGYDIYDDRVKSLVYMCLCGTSAADIAKDMGIQIGKKLSESLIKKIPGNVIVKINQKVGFRLLTKFGEKGIINLGKMIPLAGGVIGAGFDIGSTKVIANIAKKTFIN